MSGWYEQYLRSPEWQAVRVCVLEYAGFRCQECGSQDRLQVHHLTYARVGHERPQDLMVLCELCHASVHGRPARGQPVAGPDERALTREVRDREVLDGQQLWLRERAVIEGAIERLLVGHVDSRSVGRAASVIRVGVRRVDRVLGVEEPVLQ